MAILVALPIAAVAVILGRAGDRRWLQLLGSGVGLLLILLFASRVANDFTQFIAYATCGLLMLLALLLGSRRWTIVAVIAAIGIGVVATSLNHPAWTTEAWLAALAATILLVCLLSLPEGRRIAVAGPIVVGAIALVLLVDRGAEVVTQEHDTAAASAFREHCAAADRLSAAGQTKAAEGELDAALKSATPAAEPAAVEACNAAALRLLAAATTTTTAGAGAASPSAASPAPTIGQPVDVADPEPESVSITDAAGSGIESSILDTGLFDQVEEPLGLDNGAWLALALVCLLLLVLWTRLVFHIDRRFHVPSIDIAPCVDGSGDKDRGATMAVGIATDLRQRLFSADEFPPSLPATSIGDDVISMVEDSGVSSAKLVAGAMKVLRKAFSAGNQIRVEPTLLSITPPPAGMTGASQALTCSISLQIADVQPPRILAIEVTEDQTRPDAVAAAASLTTHAIRQARPRLRLPVWAEMTKEGQIAFDQGLAAEAEFVKAGGAKT